MKAYIPINNQVPVSEGGLLAALVDPELVELAAQYHWHSTSQTARPCRTFFVPEKGGPRTESLARFAWRSLKKSEPPSHIGHADGDLLNCTISNLTELRSAANGSTKNTGACLAGVDFAALRAAAGVPEKGEKRKVGRPRTVNKALADKLWELWRTVGRGMTKQEFNREVIAAEVGRPLGARALKKVLG